MSTGVITDYELMRSFREGDSSSFDEIHRRYAGLVYSVSHRILQNSGDAEDVSLACFVLFMKKARKLSSRINLGSWFYWCASHVANNERRMRKRRVAHEKEASEMNEPDEKRAGKLDDMLPVIESAIARLPESQRQVVVMMYYQGMTKAQIAEQLDCPEGTVASWLGRALERIRIGLKQSGRQLSTEELVAGFAAIPLLMPVPYAVSLKLGALAGGGMAAANVLALVKTTLKTMFIAKVKTAAVVASAVVVVAGGAAATYEFVAEAYRPQVVFDDNFTTGLLGPHWKSSEPAGSLRFNDGLILSAVSEDASVGATRVISAPIDLEGKATEVFIKRCPQVTLPPGSSFEIMLLDQDSQEFAHVWMRGIKHYTGKEGAACEGRVGQGGVQGIQAGELPLALRIYVEPSGRVIFGGRESDVNSGSYFAAGTAGRQIKSFSFKIEAKAAVGTRCEEKLEHIRVSRLPGLPTRLVKQVEANK